MTRRFFGRWCLGGLAAGLGAEEKGADKKGSDEKGGEKFIPDPMWRRTPVDVQGPVGYFIDRPANPGDAELAQWALEAWDHALRGLLCFYPTDAVSALVRVYWGQLGAGLGRMQAIEVGDLRGGEVYVLPDPGDFSEELRAACAKDPLLRDAVVYRTLLHEIGHALGLVHTIGIEDTMYFGGDVMGYYLGYRERLETRRDMRRVRGLSPVDLDRIRLKYPG